mgnify:FL=1|jgi:hypothetical protein|tara:strand:- start:1038 stop:1238 length:201 start_codon:yes stop_codon:yes gene_type:complete
MISRKLYNRANKITINIDGTDYNIKDRVGDVADVMQLEVKYGDAKNKKLSVQETLINDMKKKDDIF